MSNYSFQRGFAAAISAVLLATVLSVQSAWAEQTLQRRLVFSGAIGGIIRGPNTNQDHDNGNAFAEAWAKGDLELWRSGDTVLKAFVLANYVRDTKPFAYNNTKKIGVGLSLAMRPHKDLELTFSARHDWFSELNTPTRRQGWRFAVDYYYYKYWAETEPKEFMGLSKHANIFKSYGTLAAPGSLIKGDYNVVLTLGGEYSADFQIPRSEFLFTPFVDTHFSWDADNNNYNNKIIPAIGIKIRRPIKNGELFAGVKYEVDYRWINNSVDTGPIVFVGWYKGF